MIFVRKLWNAIVSETNRDYGLNENSIDVRFMFVVYWFNLNERKEITTKALMKRIHKEYLQHYKTFDKVSFVAFERSVYRVFDRLRRDYPNIFDEDINLIEMCDKLTINL